jgi:hypothetical protein
MGKPAVAPVLMDGVVIGYVTAGSADDVSPNPLGEGPGLGAPAPSPHSFPYGSSTSTPYQSGLGEDHASPRSSPHTIKHRTHSGNIPTGTHGVEHPRDEKGKQPTFRPGISPLGKNERAKPPHLSTADITQAVHGKAEPTFPNISRGNGGVDRSSIAKELEGNEALTRRYAQMTVGEIYYNRASERAKIVQAETAANRALIRGHSLEQALWLHGHGTDRLGGVGHGDNGYYPMSTMNRGMTEAQYQDFKTNILPKVLAGSDEAKGFTGNASGDVAAHQIAKGQPYMDLRSEGGDQYFKEGPFTHPLPRLPAGTASTGFDASGKPVGVTRLGSGGTAVGVGPVANPSPSGKLGAAPGYNPDLKTIDPRLMEILGAAKSQFEALHPGWTVGATSGRRSSAGQGQHASEAGAVDLQIRDQYGRALPNFGADSSGLYTELAKIARGEMLARHPKLEPHLNWGGYFGADKRPGLANPATGAGKPDLMHYDLGGKAYAGRAGITEAYRKLGTLPGIKYGQSLEQPKKSTDTIHGSPL